MKKLVLSISMFLIAATTFAQSEVVTDSIPPISLDGYKNFNGFMLDMGSMIVAPPPLIAPQLYYQPYNNNTIANYNEIRLKLFNTTLTELHAMAALAIIGLSKIPYSGNRIPAATGMPIKL